jgi:hypothetical protein
MVTPGDHRQADCAGQAVRDEGNPTSGTLCVGILLDRAVVGDGYRRVIVQIGERARKMRCKSVRTFRIARILEVRLDGDPVAPEFSNSHLPPHELGCETRNESFAQPLVRVSLGAGLPINGPRWQAPEIDCQYPLARIHAPHLDAPESLLPRSEMPPQYPPIS